MQAYRKVRYAGFLFKTARTQMRTKYDNSNIRKPFNVVGGGNRLELQSFYGTIRYILTHELYPNSGQTRCVLIVDWFANCGINPVTGNPLVDPNRLERDYTFLDDIYQIPVAVWPYNLLGADPATLQLGS